jgi:hypothetical protein
MSESEPLNDESLVYQPLPAESPRVLKEAVPW